MLKRGASVQMYVCLCNAIKDTELEALAREGIRQAEDAYVVLGVEISCSTCVDYVQAVLDEATGTQNAA